MWVSLPPKSILYETVGRFHDGGANSLRRPAVFVSGVHKKCREPETVGRFHDGGAQSPRRPVREWSAEDVQRA